MGLSNLYQQVCVLIGRKGGVLLEHCFSVVEVGQMSEWGWVVYNIRCFQWAVQVGSKWYVGWFCEEGVSSICLDSASKQMSASRYGWRGLVRFSVWYSGETEGDGSGGVFKFSSSVTFRFYCR